MEEGPARLLEAARNLGRTLDPSRLLVVVCEEATRVAGADYADVFLGNPDQGLRVEATYGRPGTAIGARLESGEGIAGKAIERGETVAGTRTLAVPLRWDGELRGALAVEYGGERERTLAEEALLEGLADLAGAAYRNAREHAELALAARVDSLTGCLNHAAMHDTLTRELERSRRSGQPLSVVIADLDDFKQVNEAHGHLMGDEVLQRVGTALRETVRAYDVVARYGGDEFVVLAIDADERTAAEVAGRGVEGIQRALATLPLGGTRTAATAGVAQWNGDESPTMLIARADTALLYGKQHGSRGLAVAASTVPAGFRPDRSGRR
ncbi:MAG TPA: sensor domain-containing diguanylate cyclase [Thermoleophilaceae bacterium]|jgi:diguanylate cyclase (GGDEF)-like protein